MHSSRAPNKTKDTLRCVLLPALALQFVPRGATSFSPNGHMALAQWASCFSPNGLAEGEGYSAIVTPSSSSQDWTATCFAPNGQPVFANGNLFSPKWHQASAKCYHMQSAGT